MITRKNSSERIDFLLESFPVVAILGARQVGKTTLARAYASSRPGATTWLDLEDPRDLARLADPMLALERLTGLVVLDEVQRVPEVFATLRVLADRDPLPARFLVLGSAAPELLRQSSETLAGRIAYEELSPFCLQELFTDDSGEDLGSPAQMVSRLWVRGGFPRSYLAPDEAVSVEWRRQFVSTYLQRDLPGLGVGVPSATMRRFWTMLAHAHGQRWNASAIGRSLGVADTTATRYLETLVDTFTVRRLPPYLTNVAKRQVKAPRVYLRDSGLLHSLLGLDDLESIERHPILGASWEGFALEQVIAANRLRDGEVFHWRTQAGAEVDLVVERGGRRWGFEMKRTSSPATTRSMHIALEDLELERLYVVYPGPARFPLSAAIEAVPVSEVAGLV